MALYTIYGTRVPGASSSGLYTLGVDFISSVNGNVTGVKFYKIGSDTGTHIGKLWSAGGALLNTVTFTGETASGWQTMNFASPTALTAGVHYIISVYRPSAWAYDSGTGAGGAFSGPLSSVAGSAHYISADAFPNSTSDNWYAIDVVFDDLGNWVPPTAIMSKIGEQRAFGLRGINMGGLDNTMQVGVRKETVDGSPSAPSLALDYPGFWRFRWSIKTGPRTIYVSAKQNSTGSYRPSLVVKANPDVGLINDVSGSAPDGSGWKTIGPVTFTATGNGAVWVELHNNTTTFYTPGLFDHIITT